MKKAATRFARRREPRAYGARTFVLTATAETYSSILDA
jgi:hypothetical protein